MSDTKYNSDELVPPSFLNEHFVVNLIKAVEKDEEIQLLSHEIKPGSGVGDHYSSVMFKIIVTYTTNGRTIADRRFIMKTMPEAEGEKKDLLKDNPIFDNEIRMYTEALPAMAKILSQHGEKPWWPTLVYHSVDPLTIVFDDLTQEAFEMVYQPLNMSQMHIIVEKLAKYHALSMVIAQSEEQSQVVTQFVGAFDMLRMRPILASLMAQAENLGKKAKTWPGFEKIGSKIESSMERYFEKFAACYQTQSKYGFNVLNHGDLHLRNLMFRRDDEGALSDVTFLDFQAPLYLTPGFDVVYMVNATGDRDVRMRKYEVVKMYHKELVKSLEVYGYRGDHPSVIDVRVEILQVAPLEAFQILCFMPVFQLDLEGIEIGELFNSRGESPMVDALKKLYVDPEFMAEMKGLLYHFDNLGVFD